MSTVTFAANRCIASLYEYYLNSEHYEALYSKEYEQSLVVMHSCKVRKKRKTV